MILNDLTTGTLIKRYKRFMVDVQTEAGVITAHCPNTGTMAGLLEPGNQVYLSLSPNPQRKYPHTLEVIQLADQTLVMVNTARSNHLVNEALHQGWLAGIHPQDHIRSEVKSSEHSRLDFKIASPAGNTWIEVKNATLAGPNHPQQTQFPDAVTARGAKHLAELTQLVGQGDQAIILFLVSRSDGTSFAPAAHIDPHYTQQLQLAVQQGVKVRALKLCFNTTAGGLSIEGREEVPVILPPPSQFLPSSPAGAGIL